MSQRRPYSMRFQITIKQRVLVCGIYAIECRVKLVWDGILLLIGNNTLYEPSKRYKR